MPIIDTEATGANIRFLRDRAGMTNKDIAEALGFTTRNAIYRWLTGDAMPTLDNIVILASIFGVTIDEIIITKTA